MNGKMNPFTKKEHLWNYLDAIALTSTMFENEKIKFKEQLNEIMLSKNNELMTLQKEFENTIQSKDNELHIIAIKLENLKKTKDDEFRSLESKLQKIIRQKDEEICKLNTKLREYLQKSNNNPSAESNKQNNKNYERREKKWVQIDQF